MSKRLMFEFYDDNEAVAQCGGRDTVPFLRMFSDPIADSDAADFADKLAVNMGSVISAFPPDDESKCVTLYRITVDVCTQG